MRAFAERIGWRIQKNDEAEVQQFCEETSIKRHVFKVWMHNNKHSIGSPIRIACCLLLLAIQLVVGISHPSWIFLPFFVCSCVCLVDWSLTSNFLGLFRCRISNKSTLYGQFLTSKVSQINYLGFRLYRALPFLYELRCMLDWSCTTTSLTLYDWLKLEDIYSSLFLVKCDAVLNRASHKQGQKQSRMTKFCSGICLFFILICIIWAPMLIHSSGNPTNIANPIKDVSVQIDIKATGGRLTPFQTTLCEILPYQSLELFDKHYLETFNVQDIQLICCQSDSSTMWLVNPVVQQRYIRSLNSTFDFIFTWVFMRERPKGKEAVKSESFVEQSPDDLKQVLNGTKKSIRLLNAYPRYFGVTSSGDVRRLEQTDISVSGDLFLNHGSPSWWSFHDANALRKMECEGMSGPLAIVVSEETPQDIIGATLSKFSIWSLYITFVLVFGRFIRQLFSDTRMRIPYENLQSCERLIAICERIYAARAEGKLEVEKVLYWTLVKTYTSSSHAS